MFKKEFLGTSVGFPAARLAMAERLASQSLSRPSLQAVCLVVSTIAIIAAVLSAACLAREGYACSGAPRLKRAVDARRSLPWLQDEAIKLS